MEPKKDKKIMALSSLGRSSQSHIQGAKVDAAMATTGWAAPKSTKMELRPEKTPRLCPQFSRLDLLYGLLPQSNSAFSSAGSSTAPSSPSPPCWPTPSK